MPATGWRSTARPGIITTAEVPLREAEIEEHLETVLEWSDELRRLRVRANADTPEDAARAREFGAEGIGLCRTEHMFMAAERQPLMRALIMAEEEDQRREALGRAACPSSRGTSKGSSRRWRGCR